MNAAILEFPRRCSAVVRIEREGDAWLVLCRQFGWVHGSRRDALDEARELARSHGLPVREAAPC